jgi:hypothetical protein
VAKRLICVACCIVTALCCVHIPSAAKDESVYFPNGDADRNGIIDGSDLLTVRQGILGISKLDSEAAAYADFNADGSCDSTDMLLLSQHILNIRPLPSDVTHIYGGTRDAWLWPFSRTSIWNMPLGSEAQYEPAGFKSSYCIGFDREYHAVAGSDATLRNVYAPGGASRWPGNTSWLLGRIYIDDDTIIPESSGNACTAILQPDGCTIEQCQPTCRPEAGSNLVGWLYGKDGVDIYSDGIGGTHYGSGLSAFGGSIRPGDLTSDEPIRHALKINVWANKYCYYGEDVKGFVWPADRCDSYANTEGHKLKYGGSNNKLAMGTLLALPRNITPESLGITSKPGKKIFYALQNYGAYIADDSAWNSYDFSISDDAANEFQRVYGYSFNSTSNSPNAIFGEMQAIIGNLCIITNNSPSSVGGGGTPCKPLAPNFAD